MLEAAIKAKMVKAIRDGGGYGRRYEDQFAVGLPDTILIPAKSKIVFFVEVKRIKANVFGCTPRQAIELERVNDASPDAGVGLMIGYHDKSGIMYLSRPSDVKIDYHGMQSCSRFADLEKALNDYWFLETERRSTRNSR